MRDLGLEGLAARDAGAIPRVSQGTGRARAVLSRPAQSVWRGGRRRKGTRSGCASHDSLCARAREQMRQEDIGGAGVERGMQNGAMKTQGVARGLRAHFPGSLAMGVMASLAC